ncbi:response regulator transcription factor [uncultured Ramlibacter sp.]|uniref:helix-turn-helix transcriptional regulator n=1 Tax=uncultured Ramlibacter sp. TaxID=260755 RepID=UPI002637B9D8|nr:response regulator transcription factor [uncultured Ramlibacter sp.]
MQHQSAAFPARSTAATPSTIRCHVLHTEPIVAAGVMAILCRARPNGSAIELADSVENANVLVTDLPSVVARASGHEPRLRCERPTLVLSHQCRQAEVHSALRMGATGYIVLGGGRADLLGDAVHALARGQRFFCPVSAPKMADSWSNVAFTNREQSVLQSLARGSANKVIAQHLQISLGTVKGHVRAIMSKLCAATRTQATSIAIERGLVKASDAFAPVSGYAR